MPMIAGPKEPLNEKDERIATLLAVIASISQEANKFLSSGEDSETVEIIARLADEALKGEK